MPRLLPRFLALLLTTALITPAWGEQHPEQWVTYPGGEGPGAGKHIVLVSGDDEYRSEEALPMLGKILSQRYGFKCTVLFAVDPKSGEIVPNHQTNIPGLEALQTADLMLLGLRFRNLPNEQMAHIDAYLNAGKPVVGLRTSTHAFKIPNTSPYHKYSFNSGVEGWRGGFGKQILGESWVAHHGAHGRESTRGIIAEGAKDHPITRGIAPASIWGDSDVYTVRLPLPGDSKPIVLGAVLVGMNPDDEVLVDKPDAKKQKNNPMMPVAWTKTYEVKTGNKGRVFTTTMGAATDLVAEGSRRMVVQGAFWALGMEDQIPAQGLNVDFIGEYKPSRFGFSRGNNIKHKAGVKPSDYQLQ